MFIENDAVAGLRSKKLHPTGKNFYNGQSFAGYDAPQREDEKVMEVLTDKAVAWLGQQTKDKPFFLYFTPTAVHGPVTPSPATRGRSKCGPYGDYLLDLDQSVGRLLDALDKQGLAENTLVIFTSDNGGENKGTHGGHETRAIKAGLKMNGPWRAGKHSIYEGGFRVPFLARWPGRIPAGTVCDETLSLVDMMATLGAAADAKSTGEDSFNFLPALLGKKSDAPLRPHLITHSANGAFAIRQGPWKWLEAKAHTPNRGAGADMPKQSELYDLRNDPREQRNVIADHPAKAQELATLLNQCREATHTR